MYKYYWVPSDPCAVLQSSSWFVCLSSCTNTTECHLTLVQYCSLDPGLCVWVHVQILLSTEFMYKYYWVPSDPCAVLQSLSSWFVCLSSCTNTTEFMYKYYWVPSDPCAVLQSSSWFVCLSSCTNTTECHLTLVQYCSLAPGLCVWVHVQILLSAIWPLCSTAV